MREVAWGKGGYGEERFDWKSDLEFSVGVLLFPQRCGESIVFLAVN